jgi:hypothetical protein
MSVWCHERTHAVQQSTSFNDLVGEQQHRLRDGQPEARRLFDWEIARIGARHNFGNVPCGAPILFAKVLLAAAELAAAVSRSGIGH